MEFERTYYLLYGRVLSNVCVKKGLTWLLASMIIISKILGFLSISTFIGIHLSYFQNPPGCIKKAIETQIFAPKSREELEKLKINGEFNISDIVENFWKYKQEKQGFEQLGEYDVLKIGIMKGEKHLKYINNYIVDRVINKETSIGNVPYEDIDKNYTYSTFIQVAEMPTPVLQYHNISTHYLYFPYRCELNSLWKEIAFPIMGSLDTVLLNELHTLFPLHEEGYVKSSVGAYYFWTNKTNSFIPNFTDSPAIWLGEKFVVFALALSGFFVISLISSFVIRVAMLSFPILLIILQKLIFCISGTAEDIISSFLYRMIPWIGGLAAYMRRRGRSQCPLITAFILFPLTIYFLYGGFYDLWDEIFLPHSPKSSGFCRSYLSYVGMMEFLNFMFIRSRISIKFWPKLLTFGNVLTLCYVYSYFYGFVDQALLCLVIFSFTIFLIFLRLVEIPALEGDPLGDYTPTMGNPRMGYIPIMMAQVGAISDVWTSFFVINFRSEFHREEQVVIREGVNPIQMNFSVREEEVALVGEGREMEGLPEGVRVPDSPRARAAFQMNRLVDEEEVDSQDIRLTTPEKRELALDMEEDIQE